ncbi:hypothetical protein, partial [Klebsiella pneumoniae]|uniref:hypothetical protein n=1 Tax=Klebsiella pneumoniae TaxID=573 RepID=UPI001CA33BF6
MILRSIINAMMLAKSLPINPPDAAVYVDRDLTITAIYLFEKPIAFYLYSSFAPSDSYVL